MLWKPVESGSEVRRSAGSDRASAKILCRQIALILLFSAVFLMLDFATAAAQKSAVAPAFYLPLGLAIALVLWGGPRYWSLILICELTGAVVCYHRPLFSWCGIPGALAIYVFYAAGFYLVRRWWSLDARLTSVRDVGRMAVAFSASAIPTAFVGTLTLVGDGVIPRAAFEKTAVNWWESDAIAIVTFTPMLLLYLAPRVTAWMNGAPNSRVTRLAQLLTWQEIAERIVQAASIAAALWLVFDYPPAIPYQPLYALFIPVIWIAVRHGLRGASLATFAINCGAMFIADSGHTDPTSLPTLQLAMMTLAVTGLCVGAVVTERRHAEMALERSEFNLSRAQSVAKIGSWTLDLPTGAVEWSEETYRIFKIVPGTPVTFAVLENMIHPDDRDSFREHWASARASGKYDFVHRFQVEEQTKWLRGCAELERGRDGKSLVAIGIVQDVTERRRTQEALRQAEEKYRGMFEDAVVGMYQSDPEGRLLTVNRALAAMFGYRSPEEMLSQVSEMPRKVKGDQLRQDAFRFLLSAKGLVRDLEYEACRADGEDMWLLENAREVHGADGRTLFIEGAVHDISQRKLLEAQLQQAQKMEAVGRLAGGVAHDFNNSLGVMMGYSELVQLEFEPRNPVHGKMEEILKAGRRAASLTRQLLAFSRKQVIQPVVLDFDLIVADTEKMLRRLIGENIELALTRGPEQKRVRADKGQIEQILMNLAVNARDAMPRGGKLVIETARIEVADHSSLRVFLKPGDYVRLRVIDEGCGMSDEVQSHIFEPFFTTKEPDKGTGLGLSTVYGIVKQSDGYLLVDSELGVGTTFSIYLPQVDAACGASPSATEPPKIPTGTETILLVEDEDSLRNLAQGCLQSRGYNILSAPNGEDALKVAEQCPGIIHLLLTDVIMPGLSGRELADELKHSRPDVKVLYMSGYTHDLVTQEGILETGSELLQKPFSINALMNRVRDILDGRTQHEQAECASASV